MSQQIAAPGPRALTASSVGIKILMAVTGSIFAGFVLVHMYGNLKIFAGEGSFNSYAHHLRTIGEPMLPYQGVLWGLRIVLLGSLLLHVWAAAKLWKRANHARPIGYAVKKRTKGLFSASWMRWGGSFLLLFIIWHLLQFTVVKFNVNAGVDATGLAENPYRLVIASFQVWWVTLVYLAAMAALAMHLVHGLWSAQQTLGWTGSAAARRRAKLSAWVVGVIIPLGFSLVPLAVLLGITK